MKIGVLMGGISSEREVSIQSGRQIIEGLKATKHEVIEITIQNKQEVIEKVRGLDFVFIALHGKFGEDGMIQSVLEVLGIPYSGCDTLCSALCMDKMQTKRILKAEGIRVPEGFLYHKKKSISHTIEEAKKKIGALPWVVKPNNGGSSIGVSILKDERELGAAIKKAAQYGEEVLIEAYIAGREYTVPMLNGEALPILEITPHAEFFDYSSKYDEDGAIECEAKLNDKIKQRVIEISENCYEIFRCKAYVRIDIIIKNDEIYVMELNTLPGMTKNSLFPKSAELCQMNYTSLLEAMITCSLTSQEA